VSLTRTATVVLVAAIAWGAFAFGAVYPWAYWPLAAAATGIAVAGLLARAPESLAPLGLTALSIALGVFVAAATFQLVPLPNGSVAAISPEAPSIVAQLDPTAQLGDESHALSIAPSRTAAGIAVIASLALFVVGASRLLSLTGARRIARAVALIGVLLALTGIIQQPLFTGKIYGFWAPLQGGSPYGPFVNRNHFAGWMLMGLPLTLGLVCGSIARGMRGVRPGLRERILWLSSPEASGLLLLAGAAALMTLSLVLTMSRSGMSAALAVLVITGALAVRRYNTTGQRIAGVALVTVLLVGGVGWTGSDVIAKRFSAADWSELNNRKGAWSDALDIARRYPIAGTGLNTYGLATLFYQQHDLSVHYSQAHNDYLQLAAEGGALLTIPAAACLVAFIVAVARRFRQEVSVTTYWLRAGAVTGILGIALQETVEFSLQMPGNALLFAVLCAIALHRTPERRRSRVGMSEVRV
jgi:O-antigen ligase